jgi:hypothetical protein
MGSDYLPSRPPWRRFARASPAGASKDMAGLIGRELRHVFPKASPELEGARRLLEEMEKKRKVRG